MTCLEKLKIEHPEHLDPNLWAGVDTCPTVFGYAARPAYCDDNTMSNNERCTKCWNREIPGTENDISNNEKENEVMPTKVAVNKMTKAQMVEEIERAHNHIVEMKKELKNLERYKQYEDMANELKAMHTAFMNSGFSNEQAYDLLKILTQAVTPAALRGMGL